MKNLIIIFIAVLVSTLAMTCTLNPPILKTEKKAALNNRSIKIKGSNNTIIITETDSITSDTIK